MHSEDFFCLFDFTGNNCLCPKLSASPISRYNEAHPLSNSWLRSSFGQKTQDFVTLRLKSGTTCNPSLQKKCLQPTGLPACNLYHLRRHFASPPGPRVIASRQRKRVSQEGLPRVNRVRDNVRDGGHPNETLPPNRPRPSVNHSSGHCLL